MRTPKRSPDCWPSRTYRSGYVMNRNGMAVLRYAQRWKATGLRFAPFVSPKEPGTERTCLTLLDAWIASLGNGDVATGGEAPATVDELVVRYLESHPTTSTAIRRIIGAAVDTYFPDAMPLDATRIARRMTAVNAHPTVTRTRVVDGVEVTTTTPLMRATITKRFQYMRVVLRWAWRNEWFADDPTGRVESPKSGGARRGAFAFTDDELERIFAWFAHAHEADARPSQLVTTRTHWNLLWRFLLYTGCRSKEAIDLRWRDITTEAITIDGKRERADTPKRRGFPLAPFPEVRALLDELRAMGGTDPNARVFAWVHTTGGAGDALRSCLRALGIAGSIKTFRVTAGVRWSKRYGASERMIADLRGHTKEVAERHYRPEQMASDLAERWARETNGRAR